MCIIYYIPSGGGGMIDWISKKDKMPDIRRGSVNVIAYSPWGSANSRLKGAHAYVQRRTGKVVFNDSRITHWIPIPPPPVKDIVVDEYLYRITHPGGVHNSDCTGERGKPEANIEWPLKDKLHSGGKEYECA